MATNAEAQSTSVTPTAASGSQVGAVLAGAAGLAAGLLGGRRRGHRPTLGTAADS